MGLPFVTTEELTDKLGQDAATTRGTAVITAACDMVRLFTEQNIYPPVNAGTITLDGSDTDALLLPQLPVRSVTEVVENGGTLIPDTDYTMNGNGVLYRLPSACGSFWRGGRQNIDVTCDYGYPAPSLVPSELREVALAMAARLFVYQQSNVSFEQLGQHSIRYDTTQGAADWTTTEKIVLRKYKESR